MRKEEAPCFGPETWVTLRDTGEHVKIEGWSSIAQSYRVRSTRRGLLFATEAEVEEVEAHPEADFGRSWRRCRNATCGAPLTPGLPICDRCQLATCTCGRCGCPPARKAARRPRAKTPRPRARAATT
jgi:hypothetical protein